MSYQLKQNSLVKRGPDWEYGDQDKGSIFGRVNDIGDDGWHHVSWHDVNYREIESYSYRCDADTKHVVVISKPSDEVDAGDIIIPLTNFGHSSVLVNKPHEVISVKRDSSIDDSFSINLINPTGVKVMWSATSNGYFIIPNKKKTEPKMNPEQQMGFQVMIPEKAIQERIDKLVMFKLRHEKIQGILGTVISEQKQEVVDSLKAHVYATMKDDFLGVKQRIIDSYVESRRTQIFLEKKVIAEVEEEMPHEMLNEVLTFLTLFKQAMIVGPTGSGKSTLAKQAANALKQRFGSFSCNMEASKSELVGFANLNGYITPQFLDFYENGGVFLIDEYDAMSANIAVVLNAAFDRTGQLSVPNRMEKPIAVKHPEFYCVLAGNTWGSGSVEFQGREMQDMAFLDRFKLCRVFIDYDQKIEQGIAGAHYDWFNAIRMFFKDYVDGEQFSTRSIYDGSMLLANGFEKKRLLNMIGQHWDEELKNKLVKKLS